jgi:hypothetical protein
VVEGKRDREGELDKRGMEKERKRERGMEN